MADFDIKRGDTAPSFVSTLRDATGTPVDLTGADVLFVMREAAAATNTTPAISAAMTVAPDQTNATGQVSYDWQEGDTDHAKVYSVEFVVNYANGKEQTFPTIGFVTVEVHDDLESHLANLRAFAAAHAVEVPGEDPRPLALPKLVISTGTDAKTAIARKTAATTTPTLTDADLDDLVLIAARPDGSYNINRAAAEGWRWKAAKVAGAFSFAADGVQVDKTMIMDHCLKMADYFAAGAGSVRSIRVAPSSVFGTDTYPNYGQ